VSNHENKEPEASGKLDERVLALETRLAKIESYLGLEWVDKIESTENTLEVVQEETEESAESKIVEYGLGWLGSIVFLFGIIFLMNYIGSLGYPVLSKVVAYALTVLVGVFSHYNRKSSPTLSYVLNICCVLLFYYITLRMSFFSEELVISQKGITIFLLLIITAAQYYYSIKRDNEFLASIAVLLGVCTAIVANSSYLTFLILIATAVTTHILFNRKLWWKLHIFSLFVVYITHLIWLFNNPLIGNEFRIVEDPQYNIWVVMAYAIIFSLSIFIPKDKLESNGILISIFLWNSLGFLFLLLMIIPSYYTESYSFIFSALFIYYMLFAVLLKIKSVRAFAPAVYASFSFMALSIALYGFAGLPDGYFLLVLQSLLVVSIALWFRSQIIVVANAFLFVTILLIYMLTSESLDLINFTFAIAALANARILGWRKERLTLKTDYFRNMYLFIAVFMLLYSLNKALPSQYVTLAWTATAIGFFVLSIFLGNIKYRYLSILIIVITGGHLFFVDLGQMEIQYRIIAFLVFAIISIGVSVYYTKRIRNNQDE
jgi:hypothetical protein